MRVIASLTVEDGQQDEHKFIIVDSEERIGRYVVKRFSAFKNDWKTVVRFSSIRSAMRSMHDEACDAIRA